jgi:outer membrane protein assembly factor BamB
MVGVRLTPGRFGGGERAGRVAGVRGRGAVLGLVLSILSLALLSLPCAAGASTDLATSYQLDPAHDGYETAPITGPLTELWSVPLAGNAVPGTVVSAPLIVNGVVYYTDNATLYAVQQSTGTLLWSKSIGGTYDTLNVAYDAGQIFALTFPGVLVALDAATGVTNWTISVPGIQYAFDYDPVATNGVVYLAGGGEGGTMSAISEADGQALWQNEVENGDGAPAVDGTGVYSTEVCGYNAAFGPLTGSVLWAEHGSCDGGGGATAVVGGGYVFARDPLGGDTILSAATGQTVGVFAGRVAPAVGAGSIYTLTNGVLAAVSDYGLGTNTWMFGGSTALAMAPLRVGNLIFDASTSGTLYAIDAASGTTRWSGNLGSTISSGVGQFDVGGISAGQNTVVVPTDQAVVAYAGANAGTGIPANTIAPAVTGSSAEVGVPIGVDAGVWTGLPDSYSFQWMRCDPSGSPCSNIDGATAEGYVPVAADLGGRLEVSVTATNSSGTSPAVITPASGVVAGGAPANTSAPTITGSPVVGSSLTATPGSWTGNPTSYGYQWLACPTAGVCQPISGATSSTLVVPSSDVGDVLVVLVTGRNVWGSSAPAISQPTAAVTESTTSTPANTSPPTITGNPVVGGTLTATHGSWTNSPTSYSYQWLACPTNGTCQPIAGATSSTLLVTSSVAGDELLVGVTAKNASGSSPTAFSEPTAAVTAPTSTPTPTTLKLISSLNPATAGDQVTFTATISPIPLGGTVTFTVDGSPIPGCSSMTVNASYIAFECQVSGIAAGTWQIGASYSGDSAYGPSSDSLTETVNPSTTPVSPSTPTTPTNPLTPVKPITPPSRSVGRLGSTKNHRPNVALTVIAVRSVATPHVFAFAAEHVNCRRASAVRVTIDGSTIILPCGTKLALASKYVAAHRNYRITIQAIRYGAGGRIIARGPVYTLTLYMPGNEATWIPLPGLTTDARIQALRFDTGARGAGRRLR